MYIFFDLAEESKDVHLYRYLYGRSKLPCTFQVFTTMRLKIPFTEIKYKIVEVQEGLFVSLQKMSKTFLEVQGWGWIIEATLGLLAAVVT